MPGTLIEKILAPGAITTVFQPIYEADATGLKPVILECLSRGPSSTSAAHAGVFFEYAQLKGAEADVDRACIATALNTIVTIPGLQRFSLNVFAATLVRDAGFVPWVAKHMDQLHLDPSNLIFELVEHGEPWDTQIFLGSLRDIRALGCHIALDDVGLAQSNFQRILDCDPEFLKLDRCIVRDCSRDIRRQALLRSLHSLAKELGASLIAEGVETYEEMNALLWHDINLFQGYLFSKPTPAIEIPGLLDATVLSKSPRPVPPLKHKRLRAI